MMEAMPRQGSDTPIRWGFGGGVKLRVWGGGGWKVSHGGACACGWVAWSALSVFCACGSPSVTAVKCRPADASDLSAACRPRALIHLACPPYIACAGSTPSATTTTCTTPRACSEPARQTPALGPARLRRCHLIQHCLRPVPTHDRTSKTDDTSYEQSPHNETHSRT